MSMQESTLTDEERRLFELRGEKVVNVTVSRLLRQRVVKVEDKRTRVTRVVFMD